MSQRRERGQIEKKIIQYMIHGGCVVESELLVVVQKLMGPSSESLSTESLFHVVQKTNKILKEFDLMIRGSLDEITRDKYYILISTVDNPITRASTVYNPRQLEFFKLIIQAIVQEPTGLIPRSHLTQLGESATMKPIECRNIMEIWLAKKWLVEIDDGISLGVRSVAELDVFIKQKLLQRPEDLNCIGCKHMAIYSTFCSGCGARYHVRCSKIHLDETNKRCHPCRKT